MNTATHHRLVCRKVRKINQAIAKWLQAWDEVKLELCGQ